VKLLSRSAELQNIAIDCHPLKFFMAIGAEIGDFLELGKLTFIAPSWTQKQDWNDSIGCSRTLNGCGVAVINDPPFFG
jgi:hypothetical protein